MQNIVARSGQAARAAVKISIAVNNRSRVAVNNRSSTRNKVRTSGIVNSRLNTEFGEFFTR